MKKRAGVVGAALLVLVAGSVVVACGRKRSRHAEPAGEKAKPRPMRVGRPGKKVSEMTDAERRRYAEQVVESLRQDR